jgi:hypothetical protein
VRWLEFVGRSGTEIAIVVGKLIETKKKEKEESKRWSWMEWKVGEVGY